MIDAAESAFYARQTDTSDPGPLAPLLDALPADPAGVAAAIAGLVVHPVYACPPPCSASPAARRSRWPSDASPPRAARPERVGSRRRTYLTVTSPFTLS